MVLDTPDGEPELCLGAVMESLPPQCEGIPIVGWDWGRVEGEDKAGATVWGEFHVVGTFDGEVFTLREARPPPERTDGPESDSIDTPCAEPAGGWTATDPDRASHEHVVEAQKAVSDDPDFAGLWIDAYDEPPGGPTETDPGKIILNVAFTEDIERHEQELRDRWGGPLCVIEKSHTENELEEIQRTFPAEEFGLDVLWSSINVVKGQVEIGVVTVDPETLRQIEARYGAGVVAIEAALRPVQ